MLDPMKTLLIVIHLLLIGNLSFGQSSNNEETTWKFTVRKSLNRVSTDGAWGEWRELGDINTKMSQYLLINLEKRKVEWITKYGDAPTSTNNFNIQALKYDSSYRDFGIDMMIIDTKTEKGYEQTFRVLFGKTTERTYYIVIAGKDLVQSKLFGDLEQLKVQ